MKFLVTVDRDEDGVLVAERQPFLGASAKAAPVKRPSKASAKRSHSAWKCAPKGAFLLAIWMPPLPALSGREVVRVFVAKGTPPSLIRAANVDVEEVPRSPLDAQSAGHRPACDWPLSRATPARRP